jgi:hypothetical protein
MARASAPRDVDNAHDTRHEMFWVWKHEIHRPCSIAVHQRWWVRSKMWYGNWELEVPWLLVMMLNSYPGVCCWGSIDGDCSWWHQEGQHHSKLLHFWYMKKSLLPVGSSLLVPPALEGNNSSRVPCLYTTILRKLPMSVNSNCAHHVLDLEMLEKSGPARLATCSIHESSRVLFKWSVPCPDAASFPATSVSLP